MIHEVTMYQAQCDRCGRIEDDYCGDFAALSEPEHAVDLALESDCWQKVDERLLCDECWEWSADEDEMVEKPPVKEHSDDEFIAHAREDIPWLLARVAELEAENERLREHSIPMPYVEEDDGCDWP